MDSKLAIVLAILAVCVSSLEAEVLFKKGAGRQANSLEQAQSNQDVYNVLTQSTYRHNDAYPVTDYVSLATVDGTKCNRASATRYADVCQATRNQKLRKYCEFCKTKLHELCKQNSEGSGEQSFMEYHGRRFLGQAQEAISSVEVGLMNLKNFATSKGVVRKPMEVKVAEFCRDNAQASVTALDTCKKFTTVVIHEGLIDAGFDEKTTIEFLEKKLSKSLKEPVGYCQSVMKVCKHSKAG